MIKKKIKKISNSIGHAKTHLNDGDLRMVHGDMDYIIEHAKAIQYLIQAELEGDGEKLN